MRWRCALPPTPQTLRDALQVEFLSGQLAEVVAADYDLGEVLRVEQIFGGFENLSFAVITRDGDGERRNFVRKYKYGTVEREIRYEHALVRHIRDKGFELPARVFETKTGDTLVTREELLGAERVERFFAVYEMLTGEDKYTWTDNRCTDAEYEDGARILARFHQAAYDFEPGDLVPRAAAHHGLPGDHARHVQRYAAADQRAPSTTSTSWPSCRASSRPSTAASPSAPDLEGLPRVPRLLRLPSGQPQVARRARRRPVRLRLDQARLPHLRHRHRHRLLLHLVGGQGRRRAPARQGRDLPRGPTRTRRPATARPARSPTASWPRCRACSRSPRSTSSAGTSSPTTSTATRTTTSTSSSSSTTWRSSTSSRLTLTSSPPWRRASARPPGARGGRGEEA